MATYQIINLETGEFQTLSLEEAAELASLDPAEIEWAIEENGVCETDTFQITKLDRGLPEDGERRDASDDGDGDIESEAIEYGEAEGGADSIIPLPVFVYISQEEFEAHLAENPANVIQLGWDEPIVREAVEADRERITARLRGNEGEGDGEVAEGDAPVEPSGVYHLTREEIALIR